MSQEFFGGAQMTVAVLGELSSLRHLPGASTPTVDIQYLFPFFLIRIHEAPQHSVLLLSLLVVSNMEKNHVLLLFLFVASKRISIKFYYRHCRNMEVVI